MSQDMSPLSWPDGQPRSEDHDVSSMDIDECTSPSSDSPVASSAATEIGETELTCQALGAPKSRTICDCCIPETPHKYCAHIGCFEVSRCSLAAEDSLRKRANG